MDERDTQLESIYDDFVNSSAPITRDEVNQIEERFIGQACGVARRSGLALLARSGKQLVDNITSDDGAVALAEVSVLTGQYAEDLRAFADLMDSASTRALVPLANREDMRELLDNAEQSCTQ